LGEFELAVSDVNTLLNFKEAKVNEALESLRVKKEIGQSLDAELEIHLVQGGDLDKILSRRSSDELAELFIVSKVLIERIPEGGDETVLARHASGLRCPRSWRWVPELVQVEPWGEVSPRCAEVLAKLG
jgi:isoleucyl-tRNA synthetase